MSEFKWSSLEDLEKEGHIAPDYLVDGMLSSGGVSILAGAPKSGKSTLVRNLMISISRGEAFLGRNTKQGTVLYFSFEENKGELFQKWQHLGLRKSDHILMSWGGEDMKIGSEFNALKKAISAVRPVLIVIDPIVAFTQFDDFNDYGKCYEPLRKLTGIADRYKTHILIIHHKNKGSGTDANSILGSTAFQGAVETMMLISRDQNDDSTFFTRGRNGLDMKALSLTFKDGKISSVISADEKNSQRIKEKVLKALETSEWIEGRHLDEMTISKKSAFLKALADLEKEGLIEKRGEGLRGRPYEFRSRIKNKGKE